MDDQNTDSDSHSVTSNQSASSSGSKNRTSGASKDALVRQAQTKRKQDEEGKMASTPKRKKADTAEPAVTGATTPVASGTRKVAPLSERQQMFLALAMSAQESGGSSPIQSSSQPNIATDTTPRSATVRKVNRRNEKGESPLHLATIKGDVEGMARLLDAGAGVNVSDYAGWTALHEACNHGFVNAAELLLAQGANVNAQGLDKDTPLHDAAINGHPELVSLLLKYGANPYQVNSKGESPLDVALNEDISRLLKKKSTVTAAAHGQTKSPVEQGTDAATPDQTKPEATGTSQHAPQSTDVCASSKSSEASDVKTDKDSLLSETMVSSPSSISRQPASRCSSTGFNQDDCEQRSLSHIDLPSESATTAVKKSDTSVDAVRNDTPSSTATSDAQSKLPPSSESQARVARQSLDFNPIKVASSPMEESTASEASSSKAMAGGDGGKSEGAEVKEDNSAVKEEMENLSGSGRSSAVESMDTESSHPSKEQEVSDSKSNDSNKPAESEGKEMEVTKESATEVADGGKSAPPADKKHVEQVKAEGRSQPVSPATEKVQRTRTGSMHRKKRQTASATSQPEPVVQPDGDNSKDSTDSHLSTGNVTRASRLRNKQAANQLQDDEPIPARETRRKAMLKERAAASSPSVDKSSKGGQKVPPLTIKLGSKPPASSSSSTQSAMSQAGTSSSGEPYVMLADKDTERANSALIKEQAKSPESPEGQDNKDGKSETVGTSRTQTPSGSMSSTAISSSGVTTRRTLRSHTNRNQGTVGEKLEDHAPPRKSKRMKAEPVTPAPVQPPSLPPPPGPLTIFNPYNLFKDVRQQMFKKWEKIISVTPRTPNGYSGFIINTKKYLLQKNSTSNASKLAIPLLVAPSQLGQPMKELFNKQEQERYKLRQQHLIEGEKLRIAYEQEIVRVYTRGARAAANQETPLSLCTILKDKESGTVYHPFNALKDGNSNQTAVDEKQNEKSSRSHFNNRQLISWLEDVEDKYDKLKDQMLSRHHHEAESLYAVQTMDWEWKLKELGLCDYKSQPTIDMLHVPMVPVNDDADVLNSA